MAKKKVVKEKKYLLAWSECGDMDQFETSGEMFASIDAGKKYVANNIKNDQWSADATYMILEVVAKSKSPPAEIKWE